MLRTNANNTNSFTTWKWFQLTEDESKAWLPDKRPSSVAIQCIAEFTDREDDLVAQDTFTLKQRRNIYCTSNKLRVVALSPYFFIWDGDSYFWEITLTRRLKRTPDEIAVIKNVSVHLQ